MAETVVLIHPWRTSPPLPWRAGVSCHLFASLLSVKPCLVSVLGEYAGYKYTDGNLCKKNLRATYVILPTIRMLIRTVNQHRWRKNVRRYLVDTPPPNSFVKPSDPILLVPISEFNGSVRCGRLRVYPEESGSFFCEGSCSLVTVHSTGT